jgi:hypothetical protein
MLRDELPLVSRKLIVGISGQVEVYVLLAIHRASSQPLTVAA